MKHVKGLALCVRAGHTAVRSVYDTLTVAERLLEPQLLDRMRDKPNGRVGGSCERLRQCPRSSSPARYNPGIWKPAAWSLPTRSEACAAVSATRGGRTVAQAGSRPQCAIAALRAGIIT